MHVLLQAMRGDGLELFFGAAIDPQFGRMLAFGIGGIRARALLDGARGKPPVDREQLIEVLLRRSQMLTDLPAIAELDLNPCLAGWRGRESCVLDMRVRLEAVPPDR